jgi:NAD-dependent dihydropyrimidine dehydrogenase PreA subunit
MQSPYKNLLLIYYSGTGNSRRVSEWIARIATETGLNVYVTSFREVDRSRIESLKGRTLIGFFSATHGFNMPHSMLKFMFSFKSLKGSDIFIGNTRAGMKLSKVFLPGLSGIALYFPALVMAIKGYKIRALYPVDLPSNWISLHPGIKTSVINSMVTHCETLVNRFAEKILNRKPVFLRAFVLLPLDLLVAPLAIGYYFFGRYIIAKSFVATSDCNLCGKCIDNCPTHSVKLSLGRPYWKLSCESCMKCMNYCPERAIETAHTLFFAILFATIFGINPYLNQWLHRLFVDLGLSFVLLNELLYIVLRWSTAILVFYLTYLGIHYMMGYSWFSKMVKYTSLTHFKFWRRYKIPKKKTPVHL